jgi:Uma2 family endonuclease
MMPRAELRARFPAEHVMSMPALRQRRWTIEEFDQLVDERAELSPRYELVDGELLVTPAPTGRHQRIVFALSRAVHDYVVRHRLGEVRLGPGEVRLTPDSRFAPDLFVIPAKHGEMPRANDSVTHVILVAEVLSPNSARHDRITKRRFFQSHTVPDYWIIDGETEAIEVWRPGDERASLLDDRLVWQPNESVPPFELDIRQFFAEIADPPER